MLGHWLNEGHHIGFQFRIQFCRMQFQLKFQFQLWQFQFNSNYVNSNSIPIQFLFQWWQFQLNSNSYDGSSNSIPIPMMAIPIQFQFRNLNLNWQSIPIPERNWPRLWIRHNWIMGNSVVTDVQFGHLFLVCIKYVALQEVTCVLFRKISHCS